MSYIERVDAVADDPARLEALYREAARTGDDAAFTQAITSRHAAAPDNLLYAAWFYRLQEGLDRVKRTVIAWRLLIPLAIVTGLLFWLLSDDRFMLRLLPYDTALSGAFAPVLVVLAAPLAAAALLVYMMGVTGRNWPWRLLVATLALLAAGYVLWVYPIVGTKPYQEQYLFLTVLHLPLLGWVGLGLATLNGHWDAVNRQAFLLKSFEIIVTMGLFSIAGGLFIGITFALFAALNINVPELWQRLLMAGGGGMIPLFAVVLNYDPALPPAEQNFSDGLVKIVVVIARLLLPLTALVLLVYVLFIPFNFREPFNNRDVLVIFNGMLFAVVALLAAVTPLNANDLSPRVMSWLRRTIIAVAALALLVSLYALSAIIYRTAIDRLTPNRIAFIGWNLVNIGLLALLLIQQLRSHGLQWLPTLQRTFRAGTVAYAVWTMLVIVALPWFFRIDQNAVSALSPAIQEVALTSPDPILLKCISSHPIYLLEDGKKRWIDTIDTFEGRGYAWRDVRLVPCAELRAVPDGQTIPPDAGIPPQP